MSVAGDANLDKRDAKRTASNGRSAGQADWRGFINVNLSDGEKKLFTDWMETDDPWDAFAEVVSSGAQVAVKTNQGDGGFMASITQRNPAHVNAGLCVTARAATPGKALFRALYLVRKLGVDKDWSAGQKPADPDRW